VLLRELREQTRAWVALEALAKLVDAVLNHDQIGAGPTVTGRPRRWAPSAPLAYHRWKISTVR
jgi:hypothetical protein